MNRILFISISIIGLSQIALVQSAETDSNAKCSRGRDLLVKFDTLSAEISQVEQIRRWVRRNSIDTLRDSIESQPDQLEEPLGALVVAANEFYSEINRCGVIAAGTINSMLDPIESDILISNLIATQLDTFDAPEILDVACAKTAEIEVKVKNFTSDIKESVKTYKASVLPELTKIFSIIESLSARYKKNRGEIEDIQAEEQSINEIKALVKSGTATVREQLDNAVDALEDSIEKIGTEFEKYLKSVYAVFEKLTNDEITQL